MCNKIDLETEYDEKIFEDAERFSMKNNLPSFHTSGLTGKNVRVMFNQLVLSILNNRALLAKLKEKIGDSNNTGGISANKAKSFSIESDNGTTVEKKTEEDGCC